MFYVHVSTPHVECKCYIWQNVLIKAEKIPKLSSLLQPFPLVLLHLGYLGVGVQHMNLGREGHDSAHSSERSPGTGPTLS